jgi:hypothetical protein
MAKRPEAIEGLRTTGPAGKLMLAVVAWIAEQERKGISDRTKAGWRLGGSRARSWAASGQDKARALNLERERCRKDRHGLLGGRSKGFARDGAACFAGRLAPHCSRLANRPSSQWLPISRLETRTTGGIT